MTATPRPAGLTTRAAVLGLVLCALVVSAALPLREYLSQRAEIRNLQQSQSAARARVASLEEQKARLNDPDYVAALARDRLHFVRPGEVAYVVLAPSAPAVAPADAQRAASSQEQHRLGLDACLRRIVNSARTIAVSFGCFKFRHQNVRQFFKHFLSPC